MRVAYRAGQFIRRLLLAPPPAQERRALALLPPGARPLFAALGRGDRLHALCVLRSLEAEGHSDPALLQAALLHDAGKAGGGLTILHRVACVVLAHLDERLLWRLASPRAGSWRYPFYAHLHHAEIGAARCRAAGCAPEVVDLVRHHERSAAAGNPGGDGLPAALVALRRADERC